MEVAQPCLLYEPKKIAYVPHFRADLANHTLTVCGDRPNVEKRNSDTDHVSHNLAPIHAIAFYSSVG